VGRVIIGPIKIHVNDNEYRLTENDSFYIWRGLRHRMINLEYPSIILEISGDFEEGYIVRLKAIYSRVQKKHHSSFIVFVFLKPLLKIR
jgi:mannose-6-phosphate isomerase-like protein (cupin superfamily)